MMADESPRKRFFFFYLMKSIPESKKEPDGRKRFSLNYSGVMGRLLSVTKPQSRPTLSQRSIESII
jgi:hypothetical protein